MPYPHAHVWVLLLLLPLVTAFWPSYFAPGVTVQPALHIHGVTAMLWLVLIAGQSWLIHNGRAALHRQTGRASFVLFPAFLAGLLMVIHTNAVGMAGEPDVLRAALGPRFSAVTAVVILTVCYFYFSALKTRHSVQLHARYLLATPILLIEPVTSRLFNHFIPGLGVGAEAAETIVNQGRAYYLSMTLVIALTSILYFRDRDNGRPFRLLAVLLLVQVASYEIVGGRSWWSISMVTLFNRPTWVVIVAGLVTGALIVWLGWFAPARSELAEAVNR